jgi:hypothetical protein
MDRGKARAEKTSEHEVGLDDDEIAVATAAEAVQILCGLGDQEQIEKAVKVGAKISTWLDHQPLDTAREDVETDQVREDATPRPQSHLQPSTLATALRAVALTQATSARLTFEQGERSRLLAEASKNLREAYKLYPQGVETAHALALVLAETRDVSGAIRVIKTALAADDAGSGLSSTSATSRETQLVPLWHLLALCLTARDEHEAAMQMCDAAFQQFDGTNVLSDYTLTDSESNLDSAPLSTDLLGRLSAFEKESLVQVKMTQIVLTELMEGPDDAVNLTDELLSLYSRLFGSPRFGVASTTKIEVPSAPAETRKPSGTLRSIAGSIRPKSVRSVRTAGDNQSLSQSTTTSMPPVPSRPEGSAGQSVGAPIAITVTNEDGVAAKKPHDHHIHLPSIPHLLGHHNKAGANGNAASAEKGAAAPVTAAVKQSAATNPAQPLREIIHNEPHDQLPPPPGHDDNPPMQDTRLPAPQPGGPPLTASPVLDFQSRRHEVSLLVKIWLFIAGVYLRAESLDDAQNAINDATKWIQALEVEIARAHDGSNARKLFFKGWGGGKGIDELWADLWSVVSTHLRQITPSPSIQYTDFTCTASTTCLGSRVALRGDDLLRRSIVILS